MFFGECVTAFLPIECLRHRHGRSERHRFRHDGFGFLECSTQRLAAIYTGQLAVTFYRVALGKFLVQLQEIDFITGAATRVTFEAKFPAAILVNRKRIALVIVKRTLRALLRQRAQSQVTQQIWEAVDVVLLRQWCRSRSPPFHFIHESGNSLLQNPKHPTERPLQKPQQSHKATCLHNRREIVRSVQSKFWKRALCRSAFRFWRTGGANQWRVHFAPPFCAWRICFATAA